MKKLFILLIGLSLIGTASFAQTAKKKADTKKAVAAKPIKGFVASLNDLMMGGTGKVNKDQAQTLAGNGQPVVLAVGEGKKVKIYFVYNSDGTFGGKNLAKYGNNTTVGVFGKTKTVNGINLIIADMIESMD